MDQYMNIAENCVSNNYSVVVWSGDEAVRRDDVIVMKEDVMFTCVLKDELRETFLKRLKRKVKRHDSLDMSAVAMMCLASEDYSVSHVSLCGVTEKEMCKIWGVLERTSVSSSYLLRQWITPLLNKRTCEGYMGYWGMSRNFENTQMKTRLTSDSWKSCIDVTADVAYKIYGQPETLLQACSADINMATRIHCMLNHDAVDPSYLR